MKKKVLCAACIAVMGLTLVGCGSSKEKEAMQTENCVETESSLESEPESEALVIETESPEEEMDFVGTSYTDMGQGAFMVCTAEGTSENGNVPVLYIEKDAVLVQIGDSASDMDGGALTYVYIDGMLVDQEQMGDYDGTLDLQDESLTEGVHKVEAVQYKNDDPQDEVVTYKTGSYEVKVK